MKKILEVAYPPSRHHIHQTGSLNRGEFDRERHFSARALPCGAVFSSQMSATSYKLCTRGNHTFQSGYYKSLKFEASGKEPFIITETIVMRKPSLKQNCFFIQRSCSESLYQEVQALEMAAHELIKGLSKEEQDTLPRGIKKKLELKPLDTEQREIIRPNYNQYDTLFLKFNEFSLEMYTWEGERIKDISQLGHGEYQFIIRANLLYFGPHGERDAIANLQLRVAKLRYRRAVEDAPTHGSGPMFDFNQDEQPGEKVSKKRKEPNDDEAATVRKTKKKSKKSAGEVDVPMETTGDIQ